MNKLLILLVVIIIILLIIIAMSGDIFAYPSVTTNAPSSVSDTQATLSGFLNSVNVIPSVTFTSSVVNAAASYSTSFNINTTDTLLITPLARGFNCGTVSSYTIGGQTLTLIPGSIAWTIPVSSDGITGLNWTGTEIWYKLNPPSGPSVSLSITWTSACDANSDHRNIIMLFTNTSASAPILAGTQNNPNAAVSATFNVNMNITPGATQRAVTVIESGWSGIGTQNATLTNIAGYTELSGGCRVLTLPEHCNYGGHGTTNLTTYTPVSNIFYTASGAIVNGTNDTSVNAFFQWGDTINLGNNTTSVSLNIQGSYSITITNLTQQHTYYYQACATGAQTNTTTCNGIVSFMTPNTQVQLFGAYGWTLGFLGALILGLIGAYKIKKWREER